MNFRKAFDRVSHQRLLENTKTHDNHGNVYSWLKSHLNCREQRVVVINVSKSSWGRVGSGVPQGSVLGPILFIIYINDLDIGISSNLSKFADDTKIGREIGSGRDIEVLQSELNFMKDWATKWQIDYNKNKCAKLYIGELT